ncbi:MAG: Lin0512 family protein [Deltaproteobacteria bacterium]|jgi:uncharacterized protein (TIGR02058 family)|nr:Lin0512 family protein [Deltaproteobacteria bacterium]
MAFKRYIVEFGMGADLHGRDVTKAAQRAVRDAISHGCLCGLYDILGLDGPKNLRIVLKIACPLPEELDRQAVLDSLPYYDDIELAVEPGGMMTKGIHHPSLGEGDDIVIALASLTVYVDVK